MIPEEKAILLLQKSDGTYKRCNFVMPTPPEITIFSSEETNKRVITFPISIENNFVVGEKFLSMLFLMSNDPCSREAYHTISLGYYSFTLEGREGIVLSVSPCVIGFELNQDFIYGWNRPQRRLVI